MPQEQHGTAERGVLRFPAAGKVQGDGQGRALGSPGKEGAQRHDEPLAGEHAQQEEQPGKKIAVPEDFSPLKAQFHNRQAGASYAEPKKGQSRGAPAGRGQVFRDVALHPDADADLVRPVENGANKQGASRG
ncbi:hypothetical protein SDC9_57484 [bioreactor metagenome]|uniref:Uncharacterized protein n=1 Tax=bioreactor metagenome TaxID=1076179 RepID=A0A644X4S2_9ZZZZ